MHAIKNKIETDFDVLVIGGGPAGVSSASVLVNNGLNVAMIDGGNVSVNKPEVSTDFETTRRTDKDQYKLFLGETLSGINLDSKSHASGQAGTKKYILDGVEDLLPIKTENVEVLQSLAKGGLIEIWGANCDFFNKEELNSTGLTPEVEKYYRQIIDDIGISGTSKDYKLQPTALMDHNAKKLFKTYRNKISDFKKLNLEIHQPYLALLTKNKNGRLATKYNDMDYWSDSGKSLYRARYSIEELEKKKNFNYIKGVVDLVKEKNNHVEIVAGDKAYKARHVILAVGALNTSRILIKSFNLHNIKFPFLTKYHIISACLLLSNIGKRGDIKKHSLCQLIMAGLKSDLESYTYTQFYSYKSLLLFKLLNFSKLPLPESMALLSIFSSSLVLADTRKGSGLDRAGYCLLEKSKTGRDIFKVVLKKTNEEEILKSESFKNVKKGLKKLGLLPLKHVFMPYGSTAHYAGILGSDNGQNRSLKIDRNGKLERTDRIYVADASAWEALPAKPPTLTIMANSAKIASGLLQRMKS